MKKVISFFAILILFLFSSSVASGAYGDEQSSADIRQDKNRTEITSMRKDDCRFYRNEDGTITVELELKDEMLSGIDNKIIPDNELNGYFKNKSNRFEVKFPQKLSRETMKFHYQSTGITLELQNESSISRYVYGDDISQSTVDYVYGDNNSEYINGHAAENIIRYKSIMEATDLIYQVLDDRVKETIILNDANAPTSFSFKLSTDNLTWKEGKNGAVDFYSMESGQRLFYMNPVFAFDASGENISDISQTVRRQGKDLIIDIAVNRDSLKNATYPISIDPTIILEQTEDEAIDTYIEGISDPYGQPNTRGSSNSFYVGKSQRTLVKYSLSSLPKGTIKQAYLNFNGNNRLLPMNAYRVTQEWLEMEANWTYAKLGNQWTQAGGSYDQTSFVGGALYHNDYYCYASFNITSMVNGWVNGTIPNYGVIICLDIPGEPWLYPDVEPIQLARPTLSLTYETDFTEPSVSFTSPAKNSSNSSNVYIKANVADPSGIQKAEFYVGSALIGTTAASPYQALWDTTKLPNGSYKLWVKAFDKFGNIGYTNYSQLSDTFENGAKVDSSISNGAEINLDGYAEFNRRSGRNTLVSTVASLSEPVKNAYLEVTASSSNIAYYVSANGGTNWQTIIPRTVTNLQYPGSQLKFKAYTASHVFLYDYRLLCEKSADYTVNVNNIIPVSPPSGLTAQSTADGKISLNWSPSPTVGAVYRIYRDTAPGFAISAGKLIAGGFSSTNYIDGSPLVTGTTYYYKATAVNSSGTSESPPSNEVSIICGAGPQAPTGLSSIPIGGGGIQLSWNPSITAGVTYRVYRDTVPGFTPSSAKLLAAGVPSTSYTDSTGLVNGAAYYYRVSSVTAGGAESLYSNQAGAVSGDAAVNTSDRLGVKSFWTYTGFPLVRGDGMVNMGSGNLSASYTDSLMPGNRLVSEMRRTYNSLDKSAGAFGYGWSANIFQTLTPNPDGSVIFNQGDGYKTTFAYDSASGTYRAPAGIYLTLVKNADNSFTITRKDSIKYYFNLAGKLTSIKDLNNNTITYGYTDNKLTTIIDTVGRVTSITYNGSGRITGIKDQRANPTTYEYDGAGNLVSVTDPMGYITRYSYDAACNLVEVTSPAGVKSKLYYDIYGHLTGFTDAANNTTSYSWNFQSGQTVLSDPRGYDTTFNFNPSFGNITSLINALDGHIIYTYDNNYNPTSVTDPGGHTVNYTYDGNGNMLTRHDAAGAYTVTYNSLNLPLTVSGPDNGIIRYGYNEAGNLTSLTDPMNYTATYENDSYGRRTKATDPNSGITAYGYDSYGNLINLTNAENKTTTFTYNSMGDLTKATDPASAATSYTYDGLGRLTRTDYPDGTFTTVTLDVDDRALQSLDANGGRTIYGYDAAGRIVSVNDPMGYITTYQYDQAGNRTRVTDPEGIYTTFGYDALNRLTSVKDALNNVTTCRYDSCSNPIEIVHPLGHAEFFTYDPLHRKISSGRRESSGGSDVNVTTYTYDSMGNLLTTTDPMANTATYRYNLNNQLISVTDPLNSLTSYGYDPCGNRISVTNANGNTTTFTFDKLNRIITESIPGGYTTRWAYDAAGRIATKTEPNGDVTNYNYDSVGRLTGKIYQDGSMVTYTYNGNGNRLSMDDQLGRTLYQYDANGNLLEVTDCLGRKNTYTYDRANKRKTLSTSFGVQSYEYDTAARLTALTDFNGNSITFSYDKDGKTTGINYPQGGSTTYTYNHLDQATNVDSINHAGNYYNLAYQYNGNGFFSSVTHSEKPSGSSTPEVTTYNMAYDSGNRLTGIDSDYKHYYEYHSAYTYDRLGNRLTHSIGQKTGAGWYHEGGTYTYNTANLMSSRTFSTIEDTDTYNYQYDANGNQIKETESGRIWDSYYDYENRLVSIVRNNQETVSNLYNGDGQLMGYIDKFNLKSTYYQYDGSQVIADLDETGALMASYTRLPSGKLLDMYSYQAWANERDLYYVYTDLQGSTVMLYGKTTGREEMYKYQDFGVYSTVNGADPTRFTFTGMPFFSGPGLYQMGARFYNPAVGRFITRDTYRGNIYQPWTQNLYAYCNNNPVNFVDPTGHWEENVHFNLTYNTAINLGLSEKEAGIIAWYDNNVDSNSETDPKTGDQSWHFNRSIRNGDDPNVVDTRKTHADEMLASAKELLKNPQTREQGLAALGQGLHALQDIDGHLQLGAQNDGRIYTPHDQGWVNYSAGNDHTDDTNYDYVDGNFVNTGQVKNARYQRTVEKTYNYIKSTIN